MLSAWDRRVAQRAAAIAALVALVTLVVVAATDEGAPFARRAGMVAALLPVAGSLGAFAAIRIAEGRGELRALFAIGVDPVRACRGAVTGGVALALIGPLLAASGLADLEGLFPRPMVPRLWIADGAGMLERTQGLRLDPGGALTLVTPLGELAAQPHAPRLFTALSLALAALAGPAWIAAPRPPRARAIIVGLVVLTAIVAFQAVAAQRLPPIALLAAPLLLLIDAARARYLARRT